LPFNWLLPTIHAFVTNGGYGSVKQALSFGIPLVAAGLMEDKADENVRVGWLGVGINLAANSPMPKALREAVRSVLDRPDYRLRASSMAEEFGGIDTRAEILRIVKSDLRAAEASDNRRKRSSARLLLPAVEPDETGAGPAAAGTVYNHQPRPLRPQLPSFSLVGTVVSEGDPI
jgi:hypothetical protein